MQVTHRSGTNQNSVFEQMNRSEKPTIIIINQFTLLHIVVIETNLLTVIVFGVFDTFGARLLAIHTWYLCFVTVLVL